MAVHRQLLRKFSSLELENGELRKKLVLRDERIKQLELNGKGLTSNIRQQAERHIAELTDLRESIQVGESYCGYSCYLLIYLGLDRTTELLQMKIYKLLITSCIL